MWYLEKGSDDDEFEGIERGKRGKSRRRFEAEHVSVGFYCVGSVPWEDAATMMSL